MLERICALDLRNDEWMVPELFRSIANGVHVVDGLDERLADRVDTFTEREFETCTIVFGKGADAKINSGKVHSLARTQLAADRDRTLDVIA